MSKSRARLLAELLNSAGRVKKDRSDLAGADSVIDLDSLPTITNAKLENSSISIAGHSVSLGGSVSLNTADITEHADYPYFTNARARGAISAGGDLAYNSSTGVVSFTERTDVEVRGLVSAGGSLSYNSSTGVISYTQPTNISTFTNDSGYLTSHQSLADYAPLASPALTGTPTAPTASAGTNTTQIATTAYVTTAIDNIVDAAPGSLDTLNELAAALGDDANFSTTVTNSIATKLPLSGGTMTGALNMGANAITSTGTISSGAITASNSATASKPLTIGSSSQTSYTLAQWKTSSHGETEAYIIAYGADHASQAGNFGIKNIEASSDIFFELAAGVEPLRLTSTGATFAGTISSGAITATSNYSGGSGDYTNVSTPPLKIANTSGHLRIPHISAHSSISIVYNYETGKDVYFGEPADTGHYYFRGRDVRLDSSNLKMGANTVIDGNRNITAGTISSGAITTSDNIQQNYGYELRGKDSNGTARTLLRTNSNKLQIGWSYAGDVEFMGGGSYTKRMAISGSTGDVSIVNNLGVSGTISSGAITIEPSGNYGTGLTINAGDNNTASNSAKQIVLSFGGTSSIDYAHSIRTRHDSGSAEDNAIEFWLWNYGTDSSTTIGSLKALELDAGLGLSLLTGGYRVGTTTVIDSNRNLTNIGGGAYKGSYGSASFSWDGSTSYPTLYGSHPDRWVMMTFPHIPYLESGSRGFTGSTQGAKIRFEGAISSPTNWDIGCVSGYPNKFTIQTSDDAPRMMIDTNGTAHFFRGAAWGETTQGQSKGTIHLDPENATDHYGGAITFGASDSHSGNTAQAGIYTRSDGSYGTKMYFATTDSYAAGSKTAMTINHVGAVTINRSSLTVAGNVTASGIDLTSNIDVHVNDTGTIIKSGNASATGTPDQLVIKHNYGGVEIKNLRGSMHFRAEGTYAFLTNDGNAEYGKFRGVSVSTTYTIGAYSGYFNAQSGYMVANTTVIDSSRNLVNLGDVSGTGNHFINNSSPTVYLQDTNHRSSMLHCNSDRFYVLRGSGDNSTGWSALNGEWPAWWNLDNNDVRMGGSIVAVGNVTAYSDIRKKKDIRPLSDAMSYLHALEAKRYKWKKDDREDIGFIAQDVEAAGLDVFVVESETADVETGEVTDTIKALDYGRMVSVLWQAVKEQQDQIEQLTNMVNALKEKS